ncbi:MAG TPA: hypothetical protein PLD95_04495 [bacterium]|jgi:uncharacterized membrane protein|nr:hypothetical protein [bacterium]HOG38694.1 hypothetical protein [bacterium]HQI03550.1 hypothetical protein [bacterium]
MGKNSNFLLISIVLVIAYVILVILKNKNTLKELHLKRIFNIGLLISFIAVLYSSLSSIFWRDYGITFPYIFNHTSWGIIMIWLSIFHFLERLWFFKPMLKLKKRNIQNQENIKN